ncbi:hypothetical protein PTSG_09398 [Salpingoeca rosetta]|uniref:Cilia- and flagella-associated protein 299 n=1 Tax=Salpingoeca rosetta (strain ATCC 50818 / BSB-021) TaxID=946362 RepID=F2UMI3_SALR5|nr:uncharacterized protein PTSG_09398 [Salpingoeca rosetta]EGD78332.1 hypothetical protein PTSG_09398 [Salpingoeca rosetta]|eukprot:XP_004989655.1 hypothetical protein PTSG_09398 [Salpingoeca rosetta]
MSGEGAVGDASLLDFKTYEDFLDSQVSALDLYYLEDEELARQLVELGVRGTGEVIKREEFEARKAAAEQARTAQRAKDDVVLVSEDYMDLSPFLQALAEREEPNRIGKMMTIVFIRDKNSKGQEVSGYIDLAERFENDDFHLYFSGRKRFMPRPSDLSYYNWVTQTAHSTQSSNYTVLSNEYQGLLFKNTKDRKVVNVDPQLESPGDNSTRTVLRTDEYLQVVFYDHVTRLTA